jgi:uncharacterized repeat protein (TIGR01451 family)
MATYNCAILPGELMKAVGAFLCFILFACSGFAVVVSPPVVAKSFSAATVGLNASVTLTFTVTNPNGATDLTGVSFNDNIPAGLIIANPDSMTGTCDPGVITPSATNINLVGATILAGSSCTFSIDVLAVAVGTQVNTTDPVTSNEGGTGGTATATVSVVTPDLTITKSHTGNFSRPQTGAQYTITVSNAGTVDTTTLITMNDSLPAGLTATDLSGPLWTCTLSPLQCTRGDVLVAGTSFEPITLTVNVAANAAPSVTNTVTVSGGGESNTANNTASDATQIDAALSVSAQTTNLTVAAGGTASTVINVNYNGSLGAVTFACGGLPAATTCTFNPASVTSAGVTPVTLNIATTVRSMVVPQGPESLPPFGLLLAMLGLTALALALTRVKNRRMKLATGFAGMALLVVAGCGGSHITPAPTPTPTPGPKGLGTPAGTYAITVTASSTSGGATAASTVNLTVQ